MASAAQRKPDGIEFPVTAKGDRSTTDTNKAVWAAAANEVDPSLSERILKEKNWRYRYNSYIREYVAASLKDGNKALAGAKAGLSKLHNSFEFIRDGKTTTVAEAMKLYTGSFETGFVKGSGKRDPKQELKVPYNGKTLSGDTLCKQLDEWAAYGTIEPDTAEAIKKVARSPSWIDLSDQYFVLLGAGSAMGPFLVLMALGANVIAIDLDRPNIWARLIGIARNSPGTLTFPMKKKQEECKDDLALFGNSGSNLISAAPEIANWLLNVHSDKPLIVGCYVYLDGELHVKVALACDLVMEKLTEKRKKVSLAFLCTPTDTHVIPNEAREAALANYNSLNWKNLVVLPIRLLSKKMLVKNVQPKVGNLSFVDGIVVEQGPNYALAKRMQHWRAIVARDGGSLVSTHIAPSTSTVSVVHNKQFAWAYDGMPFFKPMEIFQQETSNSVMSALLIHDIRNEKAAGNPSVKHSNPYELFAHTGFHGGVWRCAYTIGSLGETAVLIHFIKVGKTFLIALFALIVLFIAWFFK